MITRILIVDDMKFWRRYLTQEFLKQGVEVNCVENGRLAVEKIKQDDDFDAIIMDKQMPVMDGLKAARQIRELGYKNTIIGYSSMKSQEDKKKGLAAGMTDYLPKSSEVKPLMELLYDLGVLESLEEEEC